MSTPTPQTEEEEELLLLCSRNVVHRLHCHKMQTLIAMSMF